jgi:hypothetical protein
VVKTVSTFCARMSNTYSGRATVVLCMLARVTFQVY